MTLGMAATAVAASNRVELEARLNGGQEVPAADPDGRGQAEVVLRPNQNLVCFTLNYSRVGAPNRGHVHAAPAGSNGPIVLTLFDLVAPPAPASDPLFDQLELGRIHGCVAATPDLIAAIKADPAGYYVNLHNSRFPAGAIRGQLARD